MSFSIKLPEPKKYITFEEWCNDNLVSWTGPVYLLLEDVSACPILLAISCSMEASRYRHSSYDSLYVVRFVYGLDRKMLLRIVPVKEPGVFGTFKVLKQYTDVSMHFDN